jgi:hypothetical protein
MVDLNAWSHLRAQAFLDVGPGDFAELVERFRVREVSPNHYRADDIAGLAETLLAQAHADRRDWRGTFHRDGFATIGGLVDSAGVATLQTWARKLLAAGDARPPGVAIVAGPNGAILRMNYLDRDAESVALIESLPFAEFAREIVDDAVMYRLCVVVRSDSSPPELGRHRDPRWTGRTYSMPVFAFGMHLDATTGEVGDVYYVPGSHRLSGEGTVVDFASPALVEITPATVRGDAVLHNLGVVHGAHPYSVARERVTIYCSFASEQEVRATRWGPLPTIEACSSALATARPEECEE